MAKSVSRGARAERLGFCSRCHSRPARTGQRYCTQCHATYMRGWRPDHPLTEEQRMKDRARSIAGVYKRRGKLEPAPCKCGAPGEEMHHPDYAKPLEIVWMCRPCHVDLHSDQAAA